MNLKGSLARLQRSGAEFYLKLAQLFESNQLIRETWVSMAHDMEQQANSLENLPPSFWKRLKNESELVAEAMQACSTRQIIDKKENASLGACFALTLEMEDPLILRAYVPVIRHLRTEFSDQALEFYIKVKAHVARLSRLIQPFADDPNLLWQVAEIQEKFEFAVQAPDVPLISPKSAARKPAAIRLQLKKQRLNKARTGAIARKKARRALPLGERAKRASKRAKGLVAKIEMPRRRVRR